MARKDVQKADINRNFYFFNSYESLKKSVPLFSCEKRKKSPRALSADIQREIEIRFVSASLLYDM